MSVSVGDAVAGFLGDCELRNLAKGTVNSYRTVLGGLERWAQSRGIGGIAALDAEEVRQWRSAWTCQPSTAKMRLGKAKAFFRYAVERGWIEESPADRLRPPRAHSRPTLPLTSDEMLAMVVASEPLPRERGLLLLMRYSGLAIGDASTLRREDIQGTELVLRRAKTGELVTVDLPGPVMRTIKPLRAKDPRFFWWSGRGEPLSAAKYWRKRLGRVARKAGVQAFKPHRLRDTFAVSLLLAGVAMQDVSALLGHSSVQTTERFYAPWDRRRRERLVRVVRKANEGDGLLALLALEDSNGEALQRLPIQNGPHSVIPM